MEKPKLTGMEMMIQSLLKAAGFDAAVIEQHMISVVKQITGSLDQAAHSMRNMELELMQHRALLEKLNYDIGVLKLVAGIQDYDPPQLTAEGKEREN